MGDAPASLAYDSCWSSESAAGAIGRDSGRLLESVDHEALAEIPLYARAGSVAHRRAAFGLKQKSCNRRGGMRWRSGRKEQAGYAIGDVVLLHGAMIGQNGNAHRHEIEKGKSAVVAAGYDPANIRRLQHCEVIRPLAEKADRATYSERGRVHAQVIVERS